MHMIKDKKVLWYVLFAILILGAFALGRDSGMRAGTADLYDAIYPPTDPIYPPTDGATAPIYPPTDYIYPPTDGGTAPIYPPTDPLIYPPY
jgi:hypothetical protein